MRLALLALFLSSALTVAAVGCRSWDDFEEKVRAEHAKQSPPETEASPAPSEEATPTGPAERLRVDASRSELIARIGVSGVFSAFGHEHTVAIREFSGEAEVTPGSLTPASLQLTINTASAGEIDKAFNDSDRQKIDQAIHNEALESAKHPQIVFKSTNVSAKKTGEGKFDATIDGELTLHGVTRPITVPAQVSFDSNGVTARGQFTVRHSEYQMKRISAGGGSVTAQDEIVLSFNIVVSRS